MIGWCRTQMRIDPRALLLGPEMRTGIVLSRPETLTDDLKCQYRVGRRYRSVGERL